MLDMMDERYPVAREIHLYTETVTTKRDIMGMSNLRDALDHMSRVLKELYRGGDLEKAAANLAQMEEHLQRTMNEGAEAAAEYFILKIQKKRLPQFLYKVTFLACPSDEELNGAVRVALDHIANGRMRKGPAVNQDHADWLNAVSEFKNATDMLRELEGRIPERRDFLWRSFALAGAVIGIVIGILAL